MCWSTSYRMQDTIARAKYSAMRERSLGLGAMGFHSLTAQAWCCMGI